MAKLMQANGYDGRQWHVGETYRAERRDGWQLSGLLLVLTGIVDANLGEFLVVRFGESKLLRFADVGAY